MLDVKVPKVEREEPDRAITKSNGVPCLHCARRAQEGASHERPRRVQGAAMAAKVYGWTAQGTLLKPKPYYSQYMGK